MKVNSKKTKIIPFNFTRKYDFIPDYKINNEQLDVVYSSKLLGVIIQSDCKWGENTKYIVGKAKKRIWFLRRLKKLGASKLILIDAYRNLVRSALEMAVPLWDGALTKRDSKDIEAVQKICIKLISGQNLVSYEECLESLGLETLEARRIKLCLKFAKKCVKNNRFKHWFPLKNSLTTRSGEKYHVPTGKTKRFLTSSIPHLTRILNKLS